MTAIAAALCLHCAWRLDPILTTGHPRCGGWVLDGNRTDVPMLPCGCPVCWPHGLAGRPARPDPAVAVRR